jgi:transposase
MEQDRFNRKVDHTVDKAEFRRVEVITGVGCQSAWHADSHVGRRRQWPEAVKARIVMKSFADGAVISEVAKRHGLRPQQLFGWRRKFCQSRPTAEAPEPVCFAPVIVDRSGSAPRGPSPSAVSAAPSPEFEIAIGSATVRLRGAVDAKALTAVLRAVKAAL